MYERTYHNQVLREDSTKKVKRKKRASRKRFFYILFILLAGTGIFFMLRSPHLQIKSFSIIGTAVIDNEDIDRDVRGQLEGKELWFFPRSSTFLINKKAIEKKLKKDFSRIETVSVKHTDLHTLSINIKEYDAVYLWCTSEESDCYFMDKQGVVYNSAPVFSGTAYAKIITGAPVETLPFQAMSTDDVDRIADFEKGLSDINITTTIFHILSPRDIEIDFLHNKSVAQLLVDPAIPTSTSLEYLFSALRTDPFGSLFHDPQKKLLYIDVRFSNKVVYKFQ